MNNQIQEIYFKLSGKTIYEALFAFQQLTIKNTGTGDYYFGIYGVGNTIEAFNLPYERFICYEFILETIKAEDEKKFYELHKGTPFYLLSWTAFDLENYERAVFYMDAAIAEDMGEVKTDWPNLPMGKMLTLKNGGAADRITNEIREGLNNLFDEFNKKTSNKLSLDKFADSFVVPYINQDKENRSVISALYSFVLEYESLQKLLNLRSDEGGSIEPFLSHLFKGGLIFESLLKYVGEKYKLVTDLDNVKKNKTIQVSTIGSFNYSSNFIKKYCKFDIKEKDIADLIKINLKKIQDAFGVTYRLRNDTGHTLKQKDIFDGKNYELLFKQEIFAILFILNKEFNLS